METAARRQTNSPSYSTAYFFLEGLSELGIEYLFCNFGTDHAPIIEEIAHRRKRGDALPTIIPCPHENTAAHMAAGYAFVTGRGQGVLVHVDVGTANTATAMHNIFRSRLPVLLMAGKAPYTTGNELVGSRDTYVHFVQEPFDQASLVRPYTEVGMDAAVRRGGQGGAAPRPFDHAERAAGPGLPDDAARDAHPAVERGRGAPLRRRAAWQHRRGAAPIQAGRAAGRPAARRRESDPDHRLCRPQSAPPS